MAFRRKAVEKAIEEFDWLTETYGSEFAMDLDSFCHKIVEHAPDNPDKLMLVPLSDVLGKAPTVHEFVWSQIRDQTKLDRLRSLITFLKTQKPPFEMLAATVKILTQNRFWVNVTALVKIDRVNGHVEFVHFSWWGD